MKARESCGLFGIFGDPGAAVKTFYGLYSLQHRGQESAGIAVGDGGRLRGHKSMGLVTEVLTPSVLEGLRGDRAIGHVRYSTTGSSNPLNAQPLLVQYGGGDIAVAHNGNLVNGKSLRREFENRGAIFQTSTDSELILHLLADPSAGNLLKTLPEALSRVKGAFSLLILTQDLMIAVRDPQGYRPLALGKLDGAFVVASETTAFDLVGARTIRDVEPGEALVIRKEGMRSVSICPPEAVRPAHCIFEHIYFARPDSRVFGENVHGVRMALGRKLARNTPAKADIVISVPDSGNSAALGFSEASGIPLEIGFVRNHYVGRTFIQPAQDMRDTSVKVKLNVIGEVVKGRRVVVVDDSIIRGTTSRSRVRELRDAGAREIHLRISSPPHRFPCFYGIDFPTRTELIASQKTEEEIAEFLGIESVGYQTVEGLLDSVKGPGDHYCVACFTGEYRVPVEGELDKLALER
ncbi:MAG: amidophosphoribosyltransferase [Planctomycetota bacterium]|jgi:amidophosphoribosyltransferase